MHIGCAIDNLHNTGVCNCRLRIRHLTAYCHIAIGPNSGISANGIHNGLGGIDQNFHGYRFRYITCNILNPNVIGSVILRSIGNRKLEFAFFVGSYISTVLIEHIACAIVNFTDTGHSIAVIQHLTAYCHIFVRPGIRFNQNQINRGADGFNRNIYGHHLRQNTDIVQRPHIIAAVKIFLIGS